MDASTWESISKLAGVVVPLGIAVLGLLRSPDRVRQNLKIDAEIAGMLPADSAERAQLLRYIATQIDRLRDVDGATRNTPGLVLGLVGAPIVGYFAVVTWFNDGWGWQVLAACLTVLAMVFLFGIFESGARTERNAKGNRIDRHEDTPPA